MKSGGRQYFFGAIFLALAMYQLVVKDYFELSLYGLAGTAFVVNSLSMEPALVSYKKALVMLSWLLIGATGILFLYMLQFKYL